jgi:aminoglycoside phosphotransferase family enzyme
VQNKTKNLKTKIKFKKMETPQQGLKHKYEKQNFDTSFETLKNLLNKGRIVYTQEKEIAEKLIAYFVGNGKQIKTEPNGETGYFLYVVNNDYQRMIKMLSKLAIAGILLITTGCIYAGMYLIAFLGSCKI